MAAETYRRMRATILRCVGECRQFMGDFLFNIRRRIAQRSDLAMHCYRRLGNCCSDVVREMDASAIFRDNVQTTGNPYVIFVVEEN